MANIRVDLNKTIKDGSAIMFRSPVDCSAITGLIVYYVAEDGAGTSKEFVLADAHGHNVGDIDHLFAENAVVKVILDVTAGMAYVQNADTNAYIERTFIKTGNLCIIDATNGWSSIDKTYEEIQAAYAAGKTLVLYSGGQTYNLVKADNGFVFERYYVEGTKLVIGRCSLEEDMIFHLDRASVIELSGGDDFGGNTVPDCVITSNIHPNAGSGYNFTVASGSLLNVWEKVHNGEKPRVLFQFLNEGYGDSSNYIAEAHSVEHYASGGTPSWLCISFVVNDELFAFESVSPDSITGNVITSHTVTKLGGVSGGTVTDEQIADAVEDYMAEHPVSGDGLTSKEKGLMLTLFKNMLSQSNMSDTVNELEKIWGNGNTGEEEPDEPYEPEEPDTPETYNVSYYLTSVTSSNSDATVTGGNSFATTLIAEEGYMLGNVVVTMGGIDVTDSCYKNGAISISSVTGNIAITAAGIVSENNANGWEDGVPYTFTIIENEYVDGSNGVIKPYNNVARTDYTPCLGVDVLYFSGREASSHSNNVFYDENKNYISGFDLFNTTYVEVPANAAYVILSDFSKVTSGEITVTPLGKVKPEWEDGVPYEIDTFVENVYLSGGKEISYNGWKATENINCADASKLVLSAVCTYSAFYDKLGNVCGNFGNNTEVQVPIAAVYFRLSNSNEAMDNIVVTPYA